MSDIPIYDGKNMELVDWVLQIEIVASLAHSQEYKPLLDKSASTPYKMLERLGNDLDWYDIKRKLKEVYSSSDLHHKQRPDETLQEYIQKFTNLTEKAMGIDPANITDQVIIFLFIKNL